MENYDHDDDDDEKKLMEIKKAEEILEILKLSELKIGEEGEEEPEKVVLDDFKLDKFPTAEISTVINGVDGTKSEGLMVTTGLQCEFNYSCAICFETLADNGNHQLCCLPCGHIYGFSCIRKWLRQSETSKACPLCKKSCTVKKVKRLYAYHLCSPAQTLHNASPTHYPFTKQGYMAFKMRVSEFRADVLRLHEVVEKRRVHAYRRHADVSNRLANLYAGMTDAQGLVDSLGQRDDALGRRANALGPRVKSFYPLIDALKPRADAFLLLGEAMEKRVSALVRRDHAYRECILFFKQQCPKNSISGQNTEQQVLPKRNPNDVLQQL